MSSTNTLRFENIARTDTVFNTYPTQWNNINPTNIRNYSVLRPKQAPAHLRTIKMMVGAYGQTEGNMAAPDKYPDTPVCPYHMPRNTLRFLEPRLTINKKKIGDIIQVEDINDLINKINLFKYLWDMESSNLKGYSGVNTERRPPIDHSNLTKIKATDGIFKPANIFYNDNLNIDKKPQFYSVSGQTQNEVLQKLINARDTQFETFTEYNNPSAHGFPLDLDEVRQSSSLPLYDTHPVLNGGFSQIESVKYIQPFTNASIMNTDYKLQYTSGIKKGQIVKDSYGNELFFHLNKPYIVSYRENNQSNTTEKYFGFIQYTLDVEVDASTSTKTETVISYVPPTKTIIDYRIIRNDIIVQSDKPIDKTIKIQYDVINTLKNVPASRTEIWEYVDSKTNFIAWLNTLPMKLFTLPEQRINGTKYEYLDGTIWKEISGIYSVNYIRPYMRTYNVYTTTTPPNGGAPVTTTTVKKVYGFVLETELYDPLAGTVKINYDILNNTLLDKPDGSIEFDTRFFDQNGEIMEILIKNNQFQDNGAISDYAVVQFSCLVGYWDDINQKTINFNYNGNIESPLKYYYSLGLKCPPGSVEDGGQCKIVTTVTTSVLSSLLLDTDQKIVIREPDYSYREDYSYKGTGLYPLINAKDYKSLRNVFNSYLTNILNLANTGINNGVTDTITRTEINRFYTGEISPGGAFDKQNPDTTFEGYHAYTEAIIKVNFYNILVDAYKLIINSCICNADCACNVNCICNTNCGCNYGK